MMWDVVWCVGTNLFCMFPVYLAYKKNLDEWLLYLTTAIASMFYHLHHHNHYIKPACDFMNYEAIKMVDLVLSDMSVCWITSCMTYKNIQNKMFFLFLPFNMYVVYHGPLSLAMDSYRILDYHIASLCFQKYQKL
jgi:hypothetical protein